MTIPASILNSPLYQIQVAQTIHLLLAFLPQHIRSRLPPPDRWPLMSVAHTAKPKIPVLYTLPPQPPQRSLGACAEDEYILYAKSIRQLLFCLIFAIALHALFLLITINVGFRSNQSESRSPTKQLSLRLTSFASDERSETAIDRSNPIVTVNRAIEQIAKPTVASKKSAATLPLERQTYAKDRQGLLINEDSYLISSELDATASAPHDFGELLAKIFPVLSGIVILELWIDANGEVTRIDLIQGRTISQDADAMNELLSTKFGSAQKNGRTIASRKLIEINTDIVSNL
jgi:hypothetical protein